MIVCMCKGLSDRAVASAIDAGATSLDAVGHATGAGTDCGCCRKAVEALVRQRTACRSQPCPGCPHATSPAREREAA